MRRHAEGLIILSGEAPARGWRQPVPLVDVLRAAVAEVEDYTRIRVLCRTNAAVAGHAVADVIHLVAELAENATVFSPPNTPVRIQGDIVGRGFAVEIEDRGLGISQARMDEINANLANPPQFDLSGSDRLGLFIAGQLAQRHEIKITLRPSVYGGTTAIVLIPTGLVVEEDTYERDPALPAGSDDGSALPDRIAGRHAACAGDRPTGQHGERQQRVRDRERRQRRRLGLRPAGPAVRHRGAGDVDRLRRAGRSAARPGAHDILDPEPVRLSWSDDTVSTSEPEPVRLSWSAESQTASPGEREPVKLSWSGRRASSPGEREPVRLSWSDSAAGTGEREPVRLSWSDSTVAPDDRESGSLGWPDSTAGQATASQSSCPGRTPRASVTSPCGSRGRMTAPAARQSEAASSWPLRPVRPRRRLPRLPRLPRRLRCQARRLRTSKAGSASQSYPSWACPSASARPAWHRSCAARPTPSR